MRARFKQNRSVMMMADNKPNSGVPAAAAVGDAEINEQGNFN